MGVTAAMAGTVLGELIGGSLPEKLIAAALGALIAAFLTAPGRGRHKRRRSVAVGLLLALWALLRNVGKAVASPVRHTREAGATGAASTSSVLPASWAMVLACAAAGLVLGTGANVVAHAAIEGDAGLGVEPETAQEEPPPAVVAGMHEDADPPREPGPPGRGEPAVEVPNVVRLRAARATALLESRGLKARLDGFDHPRATVIGQDPAPGERLERGAVVTLTTVRGNPPKAFVTVPEVVGLSEKEAVAQLQKAGLGATSKPRPSGEAPAGTVLASSPVAGASVESGTEVRLTVSSGPAQSPRSVDPDPGPDPGQDIAPPEAKQEPPPAQPSIR
jgi:hypothetical protein